MTFILPSEHFILMDMPTTDNVLMNDDDMKKLRDAGIQTAQKFLCHWGNVEKTWGEYDWSETDAYMERLQRCGMKAILMCYTTAPAWFPDAWYAKTKEGMQNHNRSMEAYYPGVDFGILSPWCVEAMEYSNNFYQLMASRYCKSGVALVANSWLTNGETMYMNEAAFYDDCALLSYQAFCGDPTAEPVPDDPMTEEWLKNSYIGTMMEQQRILYNSGDHNEVFTFVHPAIAMMAGLYGNGCKFLPQYLRELRVTFPDAVINQIYYTWVQFQSLWPLMNALRGSFNTQVWGGAEYCTGTPTTTPLAVQQGLRGQLIAPCHPWSGFNHIQGWMTDNIKRAMKLWE